jgi:hypothetical protein
MSFLPRSLLAAVLVAQSGCSTWQVVDVSPRAVEGSHEVRVTRPDGTRVVIASPRIAGDSLVGTRGGHPASAVALPLSEVSRLAIRHADGERNSAILLFAGATAATFALWLVLIFAGN